MSSKIVAAVPNSLLTQKSRSGSRSKSAKATQPQIGSDQMSHSKSLAGNRAIFGVSGQRATDLSAKHQLQLQQNNS